MGCLVLLPFQLMLSLPICSAAGGGIAGGHWVLLPSQPWELRLLASLGFQIMEAEATLVH